VGGGIDAWIKTKKAQGLNSVWQTMISSITDKTLKVLCDKVDSSTDFSQAINEYEKTSERIILK
jgi:hypothetical protein